MPPEFLAQLPSLGVAGVLFVMWWLERQERGRAGANVREALGYAGRIAEINRNLLDIVRANTEALAVLREELRAHRNAEIEWLSRVTQQLQELS